MDELLDCVVVVAVAAGENRLSQENEEPAALQVSDTFLKPIRYFAEHGLLPGDENIA